jgi:hypothetical protein
MMILRVSLSSREIGLKATNPDNNTDNLGFHVPDEFSG